MKMILTLQKENPKQEKLKRIIITIKQQKKICMHCDLMQVIYKKGVCLACYQELISD